MNKIKLTSNQQAVLNFIKSSLNEQGIGPSLSEIARQFGHNSKNSATNHVRALILKKYLYKRWDGKLLLKPQPDQETPDNCIAIPLYGSIAASPPSEAVVDSELITVPECFFTNPSAGQHFAIHVKGDSMIEAMIEDGDIVFIKQQSTAEHGQIIAARVDGNETTLKKLYRKNGILKLIPCNSSMKAIKVDPGILEIQGVMVGLFKKYT